MGRKYQQNLQTSEIEDVHKGGWGMMMMMMMMMMTVMMIIMMMIIDPFYIALVSALEQTLLNTNYFHVATACS